jgi:hypothetical protein
MIMLGKMLLGLLIVGGAVGLSRGEDPKSAPSTAAAQPPTLMPDPAWKPKPGDQVIVHLPDSPALPDLASCERYIKFSRANDAAGIRDVMAKSSGKTLAENTPVLVVQPHGLPVPRMGGSVGSLESMHADMQEAIFQSASRPKPVVSIEVRILDGPMKDALRFVPMESLARMIPAPIGPSLRAGDRAVVVASSVPMGRDVETFSQYLSDPSIASNRPYAVMLGKGAKVTILDLDYRMYRIKVHSNSKLAGRVGYVKFDGLELVVGPMTKTKGVK